MSTCSISPEKAKNSYTSFSLALGDKLVTSTVYVYPPEFMLLVYQACKPIKYLKTLGGFFFEKISIDKSKNELWKMHVYKREL